MKAFLLLLLCLHSHGSTLIDKSESKFFPREFGEKLLLFKSFPTFWWNFAVLESSSTETRQETAATLCDAMKKIPEFTQVQCKPDPASFLPLIQDWVRDLPLRTDPPERAVFREKINATLGQLSLPIPKPFFHLLRTDPLSSYQVLREHAERRLHLGFPLKGGFFQDDETGRVILPFQVGFSPAEAEKIESSLLSLKNLCTSSPHCRSLTFFGPHASAVENRSQIVKDMERVSWVGILLLIGTCIFVLFVKKGRLALLYLPILPSTLLAVITVVAMNGSIHGLTLAFGPGIIGMMVDYGLQAAFNPTSENVWKSNTFGYLTTVVCLVVMAFSEIPLLRELMIFSILGFTYGYVFLYFFRDRLQKLTAQTTHRFSLEYRPRLFLLSLGCAGASAVLPFFVEPKLDLKQFDFQSPQTAKISEWFYAKSFKQPPLFEIQETKDVFQDTEKRNRFSQEKNILFESPIHYLPPLEEQEKHLAAWKKAQCPPHSLTAHLSEEEKKLFAPFVNATDCERLRARPLAQKPVPRYLSHLNQADTWLTLWFPQDAFQSKTVQRTFPEAKSLGELISTFPLLLTKELRWMFPISAFLIVLVLILYYRNLYHAVLALFPCLCGTGLILLALVLLKIPLTFMTLVALIMVMGFSVDCAVFAIDSRLGKLEDPRATASSIAYASGASLLGFFPLLLCSHGILFQLGLCLVLGLLGTAIGSFGGIPGLLRK